MIRLYEYQYISIVPDSMEIIPRILRDRHCYRFISKDHISAVCPISDEGMEGFSWLYYGDSDNRDCILCSNSDLSSALEIEFDLADRGSK